VRPVSSERSSKVTWTPVLESVRAVMSPARDAPTIRAVAGELGLWAGLVVGRLSARTRVSCLLWPQGLVLVLWPAPVAGNSEGSGFAGVDGGHAAVDDEVDAGDVAAGVGGEEDYGVADVFGGADPAGGDFGGDEVDVFLDLGFCHAQLGGEASVGMTPGLTPLTRIHGA
jgi:hypothetical protein